MEKLNFEMYQELCSFPVRMDNSYRYYLMVNEVTLGGSDGALY